MKKTITIFLFLLLNQLCFSELTQNTTHQMKLIKLTEDAITDDSYKPIAGKEKLLAVKVTDEEGKGVFGAEVKFEIVAGDGELLSNSTASATTSSIIQQTMLSGETFVVLRGLNEGLCKVKASLLDKPSEFVEFTIDFLNVSKETLKEATAGKLWKRWNGMSESFKTRRETIETTSNVPWSPKKQRMRTIRKGEKSKTEEIAENGKIKKRHLSKRKKSMSIPRDWDMVAYNKTEQKAIFRFRPDKSSFVPCKYYTFDITKGLLLEEDHWIHTGATAVRVITKYNDYQRQKGHPNIWLWTEKEEIYLKNLSEPQYTTTPRVTDREIDIPIADKEVEK